MTLLAVSLCLMVKSSSNILCLSNEGRNACSLAIIASSLGVLRPADSDKQTVSSIIVPDSNTQINKKTRHEVNQKLNHNNKQANQCAWKIHRLR